LSVYLAGLLLGEATKTAFPCCLAVVFFNACLILNVFKISQVWVKTLFPLGLACSLQTLFGNPARLYNGNHLQLYHGLS